MEIAKNNVVSLAYKLHTVSDSIKTFVEEADQENPLTFLHGVGMMLPKFEEEVEGLKVGDTKGFQIEAAHAYGDYDEEALTTLPAEMFAESGLPKVGDVLPLQDNQGNRFQAKVVELSPEVIGVDLNHPMAGKTLQFDIEVLAVREATEEELSHGHAHGMDGQDVHE